MELSVFQVYDADFDRAFADHYHLLSNTTRCNGRREVFSGAKSKEFLMDVCGSCYGTDVLFLSIAIGNFDHIWFLYEERYFELKILQEM